MKKLICIKRKRKSIFILFYFIFHRINKSDDDCLFLHMIVPTVEKIDLQNSNFGAAEEMNVSSFGNVHHSDQNVHNFSNEKTNKSSDDTSNKKVYYEVGCKIFEINKIYK